MKVNIFASLVCPLQSCFPLEKQNLPALDYIHLQLPTDSLWWIFKRLSQVGQAKCPSVPSLMDVTKLGMHSQYQSSNQGSKELVEMLIFILCYIFFSLILFYFNLSFNVDWIFSAFLCMEIVKYFSKAQQTECLGENFSKQRQVWDLIDQLLLMFLRVMQLKLCMLLWKDTPKMSQIW